MQTFLLECRPFVDYISPKVRIADSLWTLRTFFVTLDPATITIKQSRDPTKCVIWFFAPIITFNCIELLSASDILKLATKVTPNTLPHPMLTVVTMFSNQ